jgi:hypothetical protein
MTPWHEGSRQCDSLPVLYVMCDAMWKRAAAVRQSPRPIATGTARARGDRQLSARNEQSDSPATLAVEAQTLALRGRAGIKSQRHHLYELGPKTRLASCSQVEQLLQERRTPAGTPAEGGDDGHVDCFFTTLSGCFRHRAAADQLSRQIAQLGLVSTCGSSGARGE